MTTTGEFVPSEAEQVLITEVKRRLPWGAQKKLASDLGANYMTLNGMLNGRFPITPKVARAVAVKFPELSEQVDALHINPLAKHRSQSHRRGEQFWTLGYTLMLMKSVRGKRCESCGARTNLSVHHKDGKGIGHPSPNNDPDNLVTLCNSCHQRTHHQIDLPPLASRLTERQKDMARRYESGQRLREIAAVYGISWQRVSQILKTVGKVPMPTGRPRKVKGTP